MMIKNKYLLFMVIGFFILFGCQKNEHKPITKSNVVPAQVSDVKVKPLPGGVTISYSIPKSTNILYVMAVTTLKKGGVRQTEASYYNHSLTLEGLPDTSEYDVKLYTVSRSEVRSKPVVVKVKPLPSPVLTVAKSIVLHATYGGISIAFKDNSSKANVVIASLAANAEGKLKFAKNFYTDAVSDTFYLRGFNTDQRKFAVYVKDKWDNHSDTIFGIFKPLFETELDKSKFRELHLPGDSWQGYKANNSAKGVWDGKYTVSNHGMFGSLLDAGFPQWFSFDMGVKAKLSRFIYYPRSDGQYAYGNVPRHFQIWGSNDPNPDGSWDSWTLLKDCWMIKPSGSPQGVVTPEDRAYSQAGIEYIFPEDAPAVRYIRFKTISIWNGSNVAILELTFYGDPQ